jgi:HEAT repeat protein
MSIRWFVLFLLFAVSVAGCSPIDPIARIEDQRTTHSARLIGALEDGPSTLRVRAAVAIGRIQSPDYARPLAEAVDDDDKAVRLAALFALGQMGLAEGAEIPSVAVDACLGALDDPDLEILLGALEALGKLAVPETAVKVSGYLTHPSPSIRREAALALFRFRFVPVWRKVADEPPPLPAEVIAALFEALGDEDREARWAAAYAFSRYGEVEAALWLATLVGDEDERVRLFALRAIGRSGDDTIAEVVRRGMKDPSARVRTDAVIALRH